MNVTIKNEEDLQKAREFCKQATRRIDILLTNKPRQKERLEAEELIHVRRKVRGAIAEYQG
jgi:hypothetical protein